MRAKINPVPDTSGRTDKYRQYHITIETIVCTDDFLPGTYNAAQFGALNPNDPIDSVMEKVRLHLTQRGKSLIINGQGLGNNLTVPASKDATWGPTPLELILEPIGSNRAWRLVWTCSFCLPCEDAEQLGEFGELNWQSSYQITAEGLITRTVLGTAEIHNYRMGQFNVSGNVDSKWPTILNLFPPLQGFHRSAERHISRDKRVIEFTITDKQIDSPFPYPDGVVHINVREVIERTSIAPFTEKGLGTTIKNILKFPLKVLFSSSIGLLADLLDFNHPVYRVSFHGSAEVPIGVDKRWAWWALISTVLSRGYPGPTSIMGNFAAHLFVDNFMISEEIYGRRVDFSISYIVIGSRLMPVPTSEFFKPIKDFNGADYTWARWRTSLNTLYGVNPYGRADTREPDPAVDLIVDFCYDGALQEQYTAALTGHPSTDDTAVLQNRRPPQNRSYVVYKNKFNILRSTTTSELRPLSGSDARTHTTIAGTVGREGMYATIDSRQPSIIQERGASSVYLQMVGGAVRIGWPIPIPRVISIGGKTPVIVSESITPNEVVSAFDVEAPIYASTWNIIYHVDTYDLSVVTEGVPSPSEVEGV